RHRDDIAGKSCQQHSAETPAPCQFRRKRSGEDGKRHLRHEHRSIARAVETESIGAGEDRAGGGKRHPSQALHDGAAVDHADLSATRHRRSGRVIDCHRNRCSRWSPTRIALAIAVSDGFTAPMLTKKLVSTTYKLSSPCALQFTSSTEVFGSRPNRQGPAWFGRPATGLSAFI